MDIKEFEQHLKVLFCRVYNIKDKKAIKKDLFNLWVFKRLFQREMLALFELKDDDIYDLLNETVKWYHLYGSKATIDDLLDNKDKITTCTYRLSQKLSDVTDKYERRIAENKDTISKAMLKFSMNTTPTLAREQAKVSSSKSLKIEAQYKGEIKNLENLLSSLDKIVNAMTQRIAWLRQEYSRTPLI